MRTRDIGWANIASDWSIFAPWPNCKIRLEKERDLLTRHLECEKRKVRTASAQFHTHRRTHSLGLLFRTRFGSFFFEKKAPLQVNASIVSSTTFRIAN